jgi:hypothetical protein
MKIAATQVALAGPFDQPHEDELDFADVKGPGIRQARAGDRRRRRAQRPALMSSYAVT